MPKRAGLGHQVGGQGVVDHGQDHQDGVGAQRPALGHLPGIDQEVLAQAGQGGRLAGGGQDRRRRPGSWARRSAPTGRPRRRPHRPGPGPAGRSRRGSGPWTGEAFLISAIRARRPGRGAALQGGAEAARGRGGCGRRPRCRPASGRPCARHLLALVGGDRLEDVGHAAASSSLVMRTSASRAAWARPSSMTAAASSTPSRRVSTLSPTRKAAAAFSSTMSR